MSARQWDVGFLVDCSGHHPAEKSLLHDRISSDPFLKAARFCLFGQEASDIDIDPEGNGQQSLLASCEALKNSHATGSNSSACRYYIYGFVEAAQATQGMHAETSKVSENKPLSYTERAYRARVGKFEKRTPGTQISYFCVPLGEVKQQLIENLTPHMVSFIETPEQLKATVYNALTAAYPCR